MEQYDITLLGGDTRIAYMIPYLLEKNFKIICYGTENIFRNDEYSVIYADTLQEAVEGSDYIVGGIPLFKGEKIFSKQDLPDMKWQELDKYLKKNQTIFGGVIPAEFMKNCRERAIQCYDFMEDEPLAVFNAIATAEGAILEALKHQKTNIHGSSSLVLGYGRCGRVLADKLKGMEAKVTVCSRCETELAYADALGMKVLQLKDLGREIEKYEYIYNTIPAVILDKNILNGIGKDALVIDIASGFGGVDYVLAEELGISALHCPGLPGKYAPKISAKQLVELMICKIKNKRSF